MDYKNHILNTVFAAILGGGMGSVMTYLVSKGQSLPSSLGEYSMNQGIAGLISGIMGGLLGVMLPYIVVPAIREHRERSKNHDAHQ